MPKRNKRNKHIFIFIGDNFRANDIMLGTDDNYF